MAEVPFDGGLAFYFPTSVLVQFALLGLAVLATAWLGRRWLAFSLPLAVMLASITHAYWGFGAVAPHPLGEDDLGLWSWLVLNPERDYSAMAVWPLILGAGLQTLLLLVPLLAAPTTGSAPLPTKDVLLRAAAPAVGLALIALALVPPPTGESLLKAPMCVVALTYFVLALVTGDRPLWARVSSAVAIPALLAPVVLSPYLDNPAHGAVMALMTAVSSVLVLSITGGVEWARSRRTATEVGEASPQPVWLLRGITSQAPARKHSAPRNVPPLAQLALSSSFESGTTYAPTADTPKKIEPTMFSVLIDHDRSRA